MPRHGHSLCPRAQAVRQADRLASENAVKVAGEAIQALGGAGYTKDWPVERYWRDAKLLDIGAGTNEIRRMLIGRELIGAGA
jgi:isovaleryl-CoA dehydrogenase